MQVKSSLFSDVDILCLQAALGTSAMAQESWRIFCKERTFDDLYPDLIPLVFANIKDDHSNQYLGLMRGCHRYQWCKNQLVLQDIKTILDQFNKSSIKVLLGGMFPVLQHFYADNGMRSIHSIELITRRRDLLQTEQIVNTLRAQLQSPVNVKVTTTLTGDIGPRRSQECWRDAVECDILGTKASMLSREDAIIYTLSTHSNFPAIALLLWVADTSKAMECPFAATRLKQKISRYRIAEVTLNHLQQLLNLHAEAALSEKYRPLIPITDLKIGLLESVLKRSRHAASLMATGSHLIEHFNV